MRFVKGISLFFIYPVVMVGIGFGAGLLTMDFFYPYADEKEKSGTNPEVLEQISVAEYGPEGDGMAVVTERDGMQVVTEGDVQQGVSQTSMEYLDVAASDDTLNADTEYIRHEIDLIQETMVETTWKIPREYIGMSRKQFLESMEDYEAYPPLSELERGFVSLDVVAFSSERVVVEMNYLYVQPGKIFYLAVQNNEVVVLLEDKETIYINTGLLLASLPEEVQMEIIQMFPVEGEAALYDFLEFYSS